MKYKTYYCKDCQKEIRNKSVTPDLVCLNLCPQCYTKRQTMIEVINYAKLNERIDLGKYNHNYLSEVRFEKEPERSGFYYSPEAGLYSWVAYTNSKCFHRTVFPMKNTNYVKFFKTLKGAKRNFIKGYIIK